MKKFFSVALLLALAAFLLVSCGDSSKPLQFAFLREVANNSYVFNPMLAKLSGSHLSTSAPKDDTGQPIQAEIYSVMLSPANANLAVFDLWGSIEGGGSNWNIYVAKVDGSSTTLITNDSYENMMPSFSADGKKIVFYSYRPLGEAGYVDQIMMANSDGTDLHAVPVLDGSPSLWAPALSPDGSKIAVEAWDNGETYDGIWIMNADGSNATMLTNPWAECECWDETPTFTPDGTKIVFSRESYASGSESEDIYIMNVDGSNVTKLTDGTGVNFDPLVLGNQVIFASNRDNLSAGVHGYDLYAMTLEGKKLARLTSNSLYDAMSGEQYEEEGLSAGVAASARGHRIAPRHRH